MIDLTISAQKREAFGSKAAARYRAAGQVPLSVSTSGGDSVHLLIGSRDAETLRGHVGHVLSIAADGSERRVLVQKATRHPITDQVQQVDCLDVSADQVIKVKVKVVPLTINCPGIRAGGLLEQMMRRLPIRCRASLVPEQLTVSLANMNISETLYAGSIELPEGAQLDVGDRAAVLTVIKTRGMRRAEAMGEPGKPA